MSSYAHIDNNNIVDQVIAAEQQFIDLLPDPQNWIQTSYNTRGNVHYDPNTGEPDGGTPLRKNYAGIGSIYDKDRDAFISPKPYPSWVLNEQTCLWHAPAPYPLDDRRYAWNEEQLRWISLE